MKMPISPDIEREIEARIDPWLQHMRWRSDFADWKQRRLWQENYQQGHIESLELVAGDPAGQRLLDLGSGMGGFAVALERRRACPERSPRADVTALDFNFDYCCIARLRGRRYDLDLKVVNGAGEQLPFAAAGFDLVACWDVIEHAGDPRAILREIARVLRHNGRALVTVTNRYAFRDPHYHLALVNWLPRPLAEVYIARRQRGKELVLSAAKDAAAFADRQRLSEMHYFTFGAFARLAAAEGFTVRDLREERFKRSKHSLRRALRWLRLDSIAYRLARFLWLGTYELLLTKVAEEPVLSPSPGLGINSAERLALSKAEGTRALWQRH
jgi:ubiquinone/menaquinone biosynthesis C-methylase UbiE